jgi:hypothetical protein
MGSALLRMLIRRLLLIILGNAAINEFLGPELVEYLLGDSVVSGIVAAVGTLALLLWSARDKILERVQLKEAIAAPPSATVTEVVAVVKAKPVGEKLAEAFASDTPIERVIRR